MFDGSIVGDALGCMLGSRDGSLECMTLGKDDGSVLGLVDGNDE